jgi:hypothetical protein
MTHIHDAVRGNNISANKHAGISIPLNLGRFPAPRGFIDHISQVSHGHKVRFFLTPANIILHETNNFHVSRIDAISGSAQVIKSHSVGDLSPILLKKPHVTEKQPWSASNTGVSIGPSAFDQPATGVGLNFKLLALSVRLINVFHRLALHVASGAAGRDWRFLPTTTSTNPVPSTGIFRPGFPLRMALGKANVATGYGLFDRICSVGNRDRNTAATEASPARIWAFRVIRRAAADLGRVALKVSDEFAGNIPAIGFLGAIGGLPTAAEANTSGVRRIRVGATRLHDSTVMAGKKSWGLAFGMFRGRFPTLRQRIPAATCTIHSDFSLSRWNSPLQSLMYQGGTSL